MVSRLLTPLSFLALLWGCTSAVRPGTPARDLATTCAGRPSADTTVYDTTQVSEVPKYRRVGHVPRYPESLREARIDGHVLVSVIIGKDGLPERGSIRLTQATGQPFDDEAIATTRSAVYWPGCKGDSAVRVRLALPVDFQIQR